MSTKKKEMHPKLRALLDPVTGMFRTLRMGINLTMAFASPPKPPPVKPKNS